MISSAELEKLKLVNSLLEQNSSRLKPVVFEEDLMPKAEEEPIAAEEIIVPERKRQVAFKPVYFVLAFLLVIGLYFFNPFNSQPSGKQQIQKRIAQVQEREEIFGVVSPGRNLVITSGNFKTVQEAKSYKKDLSKRLGVKLKVLEQKDFYTVQIGPSYISHDDALLVFDELARYSVANLALRFQ